MNPPQVTVLIQKPFSDAKATVSADNVYFEDVAIVQVRTPCGVIH